MPAHKPAHAIASIGCSLLQCLPYGLLPGKPGQAPDLMPGQAPCKPAD
ncbi:MAG: hypothetical protein JW723_02370 [Bacteroidales bacterium]|nr:hypothetical protein [Bacteroidales bacterium]